MTKCAGCGAETYNTEKDYLMRGNFCFNCSAITDNLSRLRLMKDKKSRNAKKTIQLLKNRGLKEEEIMAKIGIKINL